MFTNETPIKSRRQSFKSFTNQLLINQHSKSHSNSNQMSNQSNSSDLQPPTPSSPPQSLPQSKQQTLPSASLILRQTNKLNPRLPRPSNLAHSTIPHSYAYGAAPTVSEISDQSSSNRRNTNATVPRQSISTTTTDHLTETRTPKPISTNSSNTTSVMIASAFERARWAARANEALSINQTSSQSLNQPRPQDPSPPPISPSSVNQQNNNIKKRRKSRKSFDPSYKYKPGDSATSDSEAGEGIADKRDRREKKAAAAAAAAAANQSTTSNLKSTNKKRRRTTTNQRDSETDSDEEGGEGIALTRGRRSIKPPTPFDNSNSKPARKRKAPNPKTSRNGTSNMGSETESNQGTSNQSTTRRRTNSNRGTSDGNRTDDQSSLVLNQPTATFYLEHPDSPETSRIPNGEEDHTMGTTDDSRFTLGTGVESYEYEEEERIVKALEAEERANHHHQQQQQQVNQESFQEMDHSLSLEDSQNHSTELMRRSQSSSHHSDSYQRSDSGLIEIEQIVATSKLESQRQPKSRKLPINKPSQNNYTITPIQELDETRISSPPPPSTRNSKKIGFGASVGSKVLRQVSKISKYSASFYLKSAVLIFFLALLINSIRVGDLPMSIFSRKRHSSNVFIKPETPIQNFEELVSRLTNLESTLSKISIGTESTTNSLSSSISETRIEMFQRIGSIELSIEDQTRMIEAIKDSHEARLIKLDSSLSEIRKQVSLGAVSIGRLEKSLAIVNKEILGIEDRIKEVINDQSSNSVGQEGANGILMDPVTGEWKLDSRLTNYLESLYVNREKVEKSLMERDDKLRNWISKEIRTQPQVGGGRVEDGKKLLGAIEDTNQLNQIITQSILKFSLTDGGINQPDYALLSGGARIIPDLTSSTLEIKPKGLIKSTLSSLIGRGNLVIARPPSTILEPEKSIGQCWPMNGDSGQIGIALARKIVVKEIVIEHVEFSLAYELDSALREFEVLGYDEITKTWKTLGNGTFDVYNSNLNSIQRFKMNSTQEDQLEFETGLVVLKVLSNHGNSEFTCLYRIRVLGERNLGIGNGFVDDRLSHQEEQQEQQESIENV